MKPANTVPILTSVGHFWEPSSQGMLRGAGHFAPTSGASGTGAGIVAPGALFTNTLTPEVLNNIGTKASPTWATNVSSPGGSGGGLQIGGPAGAYLIFGDGQELRFGDADDGNALIKWSEADVSNPSLVLALDNTNQALHITDVGAKATDWGIAPDTHPTVYYHSNTTPATDYLLIGAHDGTTAFIDMVGGPTLKIGFDLLEALILSETASAVNEVTIANAATGNSPNISATGGDTDVNLRLTPKGAGYVIANGPFQNRTSTAVTATTGGGTTGLIPAGASFVAVTSDDANKQISLPAASVGDRIRILVGATGCELISATAADKVNDVTVGATNEAALTAENLYECQYVATNKWVVIGYTKLGAVQAALVPDAL